MLLLLIIADDFTGALDTGVQFAAYGAATRVMVKDQVDFASCDAQVLVVDTETRHLPPEKAYQIVEELTRAACRAGIRYIYKKTDSALRGNIGAELAAVLQASNNRQLPFLPAFPKMGARHGTGSIMLTVFRSQKAPSAWIRSSRSGMHGSQNCWQSRRMYRLSAARLCTKALRYRRRQAFWFLMLRMNRIWSRPAAVCLPERHRRSWQAARGLQRCSPAAWAGRDPGRDPPAGSKAAGALRKCEPHYTASAG